MQNHKLREFVELSFFVALIFIMTFVPFTGYIPLGPINATTIHIPVIIGSIVFGPKKGALLGFMFGLSSLIKNTFMPSSASAFVFSPFYSVGGMSGNGWSLVICFVPRILVGIVPYYVNVGLKKLKTPETVSMAFAGLLGSLVNTLLVMHFIYLFFASGYATVMNQPLQTLYLFIMGIILANGVPEAVVAAVLTVIIAKAILTFQRRRVS